MLVSGFCYRYYRTSNTSVDLRRCRDFGDTSGCVGGVSDGEGPCKSGLQARRYCVHRHVHFARHICIVSSRMLPQFFQVHIAQGSFITITNQCQGPYCSLCVNRDEYYNTDESACVLCKGSDRLWPLWVVLGALVTLGLLGMGRRYGKRAPRLLRALYYGVYSRLSRLSSQLRLRAKLKQRITLCAKAV